MDIREFLVRKLSVTGGHLGPNLGCSGTNANPAFAV
ncbi:1-deoxy-D-xylulose-5-phosphate synthase N-terminal domain-containing protein [Sinobaca sp. H24]|nr:1-deoxy-D-xylulose-5-phosphate synthase N-terminal domain-containing protein [Sinobaca sp. H24]